MKNYTAKLLVFTGFFCLLGATNSLAQTKKIFHKSHSGKSGTLFLDTKNNHGPGMAMVRYDTPESHIQLNYIQSGNYNYPKVMLDTANKTMRFFDTKDSLIGCDRDYREYLRQGSLVFDVTTKEYWMYQAITLNEKKQRTLVNRFLSVSDSVASWQANENNIYHKNDFIRDGNNHRILMSYPIIHAQKSIDLSSELFAPAIPSPIDSSKKDTIEMEQPPSKEKLVVKQKGKKNRQNDNIEQKEKKEELVVPVLPNSPPFNKWLVWMGIFFFGFSAFLFLGVKHIVKEEVTKLSKR